MCQAIAKQGLKQRPGTVKRCMDVCLALLELDQAEVVVVRLSGSLFSFFLWFSCAYKPNKEESAHQAAHLSSLQEHITKAFSDKTPKVVVAALEILTQAIRYACSQPRFPLLQRPACV